MPKRKKTINATTSQPPTKRQTSAAGITAPSGKRLEKTFFDQPCVDLSKALLGKRLVRKLDSGVDVWGVIVETEAYLGGEDKAAHSYDGKKTERNAAMFMDPGTIYVYHIYGMYTCINFSSEGKHACRHALKVCVKTFLIFLVNILRYLIMIDPS